MTELSSRVLEEVDVRVITALVAALLWPSLAWTQTAPGGWVVLPVEEYRTLRARAFPPEVGPDPPPIEAALTRIDYDLRAAGATATGEARLTIDVLREGWVSVQLPHGLLIRDARIDGRPVAIVDSPSPHVLLSTAGRAVLSLDVAVPIADASGAETVIIPASSSALTRVALAIPRGDAQLSVTGGFLEEQAETAAETRWVTYGRAGQPLTLAWKRRDEGRRAGLPLRLRGTVTALVGLGEEISPMTATVGLDVTQGTATSVSVSLPPGLTVTQVSGATVSDWQADPRSLTVMFLEPVATQATFTIAGELRAPREGNVDVPLLRLPAAEREAGGVAVEVLGAGEIAAHRPRGLEAADPTELGEGVANRASPSMVAFRYTPLDGTAPRSLELAITRYEAHAALVANVEEARYDVLLDGDGQTLVRARYAVRNNQRSFLAAALPPNATLWSVSVGGRRLTPGLSPAGAVLLPLERSRSGRQTAAFIVELVYLGRGPSWEQKGSAALALPALDLPISRTGVALHYSPRFRLIPEPGSFRVQQDPGPFTAALRMPASSSMAAREEDAIKAGENARRADLAFQSLVDRFNRDAPGRTVAGTRPVEVVFPAFGLTVYLASELTPEGQAPSVEFRYSRRR
jgi:hypothetical protein